jgi:type II secretory pathway pseudopilin PulG
MRFVQGRQRRTGWKPILRKRAGFTILEVGVVFTLSIMLVALAVVLFSSLLQAQRQTKQRDRLRRELMRLDVILRGDAHAATAAKIGEPNSCTLEDEQGNRWAYRAEEAALVREFYKDDQLAQREVFHLSAGVQTKWTTEAVGTRSLIKLKVSFPEPKGRMPSRLPDYQADILVGGIAPNAVAGVQP